ncbi:Polygalacturonase, partial [Cucurbita argyrosperma subsp. sororia]
MSLPSSFKLPLLLFFFFFFLTFLPSKSGLFWPRSGGGGKETGNLEKGERESYVVDEQKKMVIGSRPPGCENKCKSCRPCMAAAVVPAHRKKWFKAFVPSSGVEDDSYYLLSWKCRCGNKIYQP